MGGNSITAGNGDIQWFGLRHDSFDSYYRDPFGAVPVGTPVTLRFRTFPLDTEQLDYLQRLGFDTLYLTPIFMVRSNHRYDTDDYLAIDPALGNEAVTIPPMPLPAWPAQKPQ